MSLGTAGGSKMARVLGQPRLFTDISRGFILRTPRSDGVTDSLVYLSELSVQARFRQDLYMRMRISNFMLLRIDKHARVDQWVVQPGTLVRLMQNLGTEQFLGSTLGSLHGYVPDHNERLMYLKIY